MTPASAAALVEEPAAASAAHHLQAPASPQTDASPVAEDTIEAVPAPAAASAEEVATGDPAKTELSPAQCAARLAELFPALFGTQGPPKPIKLRIQADIQQRAPGLFTRKALSIVLHRHTTSTPYLKALVAAPSRFDLDGAPAGEIAEEHRQAAREEVERRRAIVAARRAAEAQARNPRPPRESREPGESREHGESREPRAPRPPRHAGRPADQPDRPGRRGPGPGSTPRREGRPPRQDIRQDTRQHIRQDARVEAPREGAHPQPQLAAQAQPALPDDPARRERALLLRTYEASSLTKANFCVLKRISEAELDAQLALARQERGPARPRP